METIGGVSAVVRLIFQSAKDLRDRIKLVLCLPVCSLGLIHHWRWQVASEKTELLIVLFEYEKEINHLAILYNNHSALLDQHSLRTDLVEIAKYASSHPHIALVDLTISRTLRKLNNSLPSAHPDFGKRKISTLKEPWRAGDVREVIMAENAAIGRIRIRWQVRGSTVTKLDYADFDHSRRDYKSACSRRRWQLTHD